MSRQPDPHTSETQTQKPSRNPTAAGVGGTPNTSPSTKQMPDRFYANKPTQRKERDSMTAFPSQPLPSTQARERSPMLQNQAASVKPSTATSAPSAPSVLGSTPLVEDTFTPQAAPRSEASSVILQPPEGSTVVQTHYGYDVKSNRLSLGDLLNPNEPRTGLPAQPLLQMTGIGAGLGLLGSLLWAKPSSSDANALHTTEIRWPNKLRGFLQGQQASGQIHSISKDKAGKQLEARFLHTASQPAPATQGWHILRNPQHKDRLIPQSAELLHANQRVAYNAVRTATGLEVSNTALKFCYNTKGELSSGTFNYDGRKYTVTGYGHRVGIDLVNPQANQLSTAVKHAAKHAFDAERACIEGNRGFLLLNQPNAHSLKSLAQTLQVKPLGVLGQGLPWQQWLKHAGIGGGVAVGGLAVWQGVKQLMHRPKDGDSHKTTSQPQH